MGAGSSKMTTFPPKFSFESKQFSRGSSWQFVWSLFCDWEKRSGPFLFPISKCQIDWGRLAVFSAKVYIIHVRPDVGNAGREAPEPSAMTECALSLSIGLQTTVDLCSTHKQDIITVMCLCIWMLDLIFFSAFCFVSAIVFLTNAPWNEYSLETKRERYNKNVREMYWQLVLLKVDLAQ